MLPRPASASATASLAAVEGCNCSEVTSADSGPMVRAGLARSDRQLDQLYDDNLQALTATFELADALLAGEHTADASKSAPIAALRLLLRG